MEKPTTAALAGCAVAALLLLGGLGPGRAVAQGVGPVVAEDERDPFEDEAAEEVKPIPDPVSPVNRAFFTFNDKLYFWVLRPVATGYSYVVPEIARVGVRNFFDNVATPVRVVSCLTQGNLEGTGVVLARFGVNTTVGLAGLADPAKGWLDLEAREEDFGQTLGVWGLGPGLYLNWPVVGPSSLRDTLAFPVNAGLDPMTYVPGVGFLRTVNNTSLRLGEYEQLKASALDPYIAVRDAYNQHRRHAIQTRK
ncbi:MAG: VacJ family lipoprotein [bacterium]